MADEYLNQLVLRLVETGKNFGVDRSADWNVRVVASWGDSEVRCVLAHDGSRLVRAVHMVGGRDAVDALPGRNIYGDDEGQAELLRWLGNDKWRYTIHEDDGTVTS